MITLTPRPWVCRAEAKHADHMALLDALSLVRETAKSLDISLEGSSGAPKILLDALGLSGDTTTTTTTATDATGGSRRSLHFAPSKGGVPTGSGDDQGSTAASPSSSPDYLNRAINLLVGKGLYSLTRWLCSRLCLCYVMTVAGLRGCSCGLGSGTTSTPGITHWCCHSSLCNQAHTPHV